MKRRNFCKSLVAAAVAAAVPGEATRAILIHKGNMILPHGVGKAEAFRVLYGAPRPFYYYQLNALRQMNFYQAGARIHMNVERGLGKTYLHKMNYSDIEARTIAWLEQKDKQQLKMLEDFEAAESWRDKIPKQKTA